MSGGNVELARQVMDALSQRDLPRLGSLADPEVEWRSFFPIGESGGVYRDRGHDGTQLLEWVEQWLERLETTRKTL